jgi:hypothetical protein
MNKRQFDVRSGRMLVALGTLGLAGGSAAPAVAESRIPEHPRSSSAHAGDTRRAVVITDSVGAAAAALTPDRPLILEPVVSARESTRNFLVGGSVLVRGAVAPVTPTDRTVGLEVDRAGRWSVVARARTDRRGSYRLRFQPAGPGSLSLRVLVAGPAAGTHARRTLGTVNIFRRAMASWYGGSGPLACGGTLTASTLGVASKTLPCGTMVVLRLGHRTIRVPVVDRGPYVAGRVFDLTAATKRALGFGDLGVIWATA